MTSGATETSSSPGGSVPILVVEDEPMVGEVVCAMLQMGGLEPTLAQSPHQALEILRTDPSRFALLLTDFRMPGMTGVELIQKVHALRPGLKSILYSGNADESVASGYKVQPDRFLRKPFSPKVLNDLVREVLTN